MDRRTILKGIGTATVAGAAFVSPSSARHDADLKLDVTDVSGTVAATDLLDQGQLAQLDGDFSQTNIIVSAETDVIDLASCCYHQDCCANVDNCDCECCTCDACEETK